MNGSGCINELGSYRCLCSNGWDGQHCDQDFDECSAALCPEGTTCQVVDTNQFTCVCPDRGCNNLDEGAYNILLANVWTDAVVDDVVVDVNATETTDDYDQDYNDSTEAPMFDETTEEYSYADDYEDGDDEGDDMEVAEYAVPEEDASDDVIADEDVSEAYDTYEASIDVPDEDYVYSAPEPEADEPTTYDTDVNVEYSNEADVPSAYDDDTEVDSSDEVQDNYYGMYNQEEI